MPRYWPIISYCPFCEPRSGIKLIVLGKLATFPVSEKPRDFQEYLTYRLDIVKRDLCAVTGKNRLHLLKGWSSTDELQKSGLARRKISLPLQSTGTESGI